MGRVNFEAVSSLKGGSGTVRDIAIHFLHESNQWKAVQKA
jgi:3-deoxy-D-manno-octulosonate 8-phosphate phosphatase KdsC-like HAD superfamily phosphatase